MTQAAHAPASGLPADVLAEPVPTDGTEQARPPEQPVFTHASTPRVDPAVAADMAGGARWEDVRE
ncbi:MAG TPA: hypothetical protein VD929_08975 [Caulobacteraceae bacterium]|nr:hypothetical protein [Caulobacteraceae bacterium]